MIMIGHFIGFSPDITKILEMISICLLSQSNVKYFTVSYEKARQKAKQAEETSDLQTDVDDEQLKRKRK